ncbi:unknown [Segatella copri CAG:164]|nr:unknown [Segatella copri CAG:164]
MPIQYVITLLLNSGKVILFCSKLTKHTYIISVRKTQNFNKSLVFIGIY